MAKKEAIKREHFDSKQNYQGYKQEIRNRATNFGNAVNDTDNLIKSLDDLVEVLDMVSESVTYDIAPMVDNDQKDIEAIEEVYDSIGDVQKKLDFVEETLNHLKKVRNKTKDNDPTSKLNQLISNMENLASGWTNVVYKNKRGFSKNSQDLQNIRVQAARIRNQRRQQELASRLATKEQASHVSRSELVEEAQKMLEDIIGDAGYKKIKSAGKSNISSISRKSIVNEVMSLSLMTKKMQDVNSDPKAGEVGSGDSIGLALIAELEKSRKLKNGKTKYAYKFTDEESRQDALDAVLGLNLSDEVRSKLTNAINNVRITNPDGKEKGVYKISKGAFKNSNGRQNILLRHIKSEGMKSYGRIQKILRDDNMSEANASQLADDDKKSARRRRISEKDLERERIKMATHPVTSIRPSTTKSSKPGMAGSKSNTKLTELQIKQAGAVVASRNNEFGKLESIRKSTQNPTFLDNLAADGEVVVVDIENWFDSNDPNNKNKNIPVTYADATYNAKEKKFDDAKYFYVKTSDLDETIKNMQTFLTSEHMGESRDIIAQELGFVDANGKSLSAEDISKLDKKATYEFLKKFYEKKDKTTRLKNDATGKFANKLNGIGFISPEEYAKRLENKTVVSANKEHDVPILSAFAGEKINVKELVDLFDLDSKKTGGAKLDRRMAGVTANVLAGFFDTPNMQAHNAGADVTSEANTLLAMSREREDVINFLNAEFEKALSDYENEYGVSALTDKGTIHEEAKDWFRGYFAQRADKVQELLANNSTQPLSGGLHIASNPNASQDYKDNIENGLKDFKSTLSKEAKEYFSAKGLAKRLEANIVGMAPKKPGQQGQGEHYVETSAEKQIATLFQWASQNGMVVLYEKEETSGTEKYNFYVIPEDQYDENDNEKNKANSYNFSWIAPDANGYLDKGNINSATPFFYDFRQKKYLDANTYALSKNISTLTTMASRGESADKVNRIMSAQRSGILSASPIGYNGEKDYEQLNWDSVEVSPGQATREEEARASGMMNWSASLYKFIEDEFVQKGQDSKVKKEFANILGIKEDFNAWDFPQEIQYLLSRYLTQRTKNPNGYIEAIENSDDQQLKAFINSNEMKKIIESLDLFFNQGGGYYIDSLSARSAGTGKAFANANVDLPFTDMLVMQAAGSENNSKAKANTPNRKVKSINELKGSGVWQESTLRENSDTNSANLVATVMTLPEEVIQILMDKAGGGNGNGIYHEKATEERLITDQFFRESATYYGNARREKLAREELNDDFLTSFGITQDMLDNSNLGDVFNIDKASQHPTERDISLNDKLNIPKGSIITSIKRTEDGVEVAYMTETELKQAQKLASVGTGKRWENVSATQQDIMDAINEAMASGAITPEQGQSLKDAISKNNVHAFKMASPKKRSMSFRTGGSENEGLWEYLVNQIKTEDDYNDIVAQIPAFGARYKWVGGNEPIKSNLSQKNGRIVTSDGKDLYSTDSFWGDNRTEAERAAYMANVESDMSFGSMYLDVANILEKKGLINKNDIGKMAYEAIGATPVSEYSGMSGIGTVDRGESRARFSTRAKENVKKQLNELVVQKKLTQKEAEDTWKELLDEYGGDQKDKDVYNIVNSAARNKSFSDLGMQDKKTYQLVFGGTGSKSGQLKNGSQLQGNQINIADLVLGQLDEDGNVTSISADKINYETEYKGTGLSKIYEILSQKREILGETAQVQISFDGLDKDTIARLKAAGFKDGQILAIGPEDEADLSGNIRVDSNSRYSVDLLRNAQRLINDRNAQLEESFAKRSTYGGVLQVGAMYQDAMYKQTKQGGDLWKKASSKKAKMSANMKVVAMKEDGPFGVISYQGALDLLGLGANPNKEDVETYYEKLVETIQQDEKLKDLKQFKNLDAKKFKNKRFGKQKEEYQKLVQDYVEQVQANDSSLPAWILRNPIINESNLRQGLKINSKDATQGSDVIMLPEMLAGQLKADFDGDIVQVFFNLASKNAKTFFALMEKAKEEQEATAKRLEKAEKKQKTNADYSEQYLKEAQVITNPQAASSFTNVSKLGQFGLGLASYSNTDTQFNLRAYREKYKTETPEQIIRDKMIGALASSVVEQNGISAKKGLERVLKNEDAAWDGDNLNKLREAFFNYTGSQEQSDLITAYSEDIVDSENFQNDEIIQTLITAMEQTYGKDAMKASNLFDEEKLDKGQYALKSGALIELLQHVRTVNQEASSEKYKEYYKGRRDRYLKTEVSEGLVGGPASPVYKKEASAIDEVSSSLEEHNDLMPEAIRLEKEKAKASENLSGASQKEADGIDASTDAMKEHIATFEQYKKMAKFTGVDKLNVTRMNDNNGGHYYLDDSGERVMSFTQFARLAKGDTDDPRSEFVWEKAREAQAQGRTLTSADVNMSDEDFNKIIGQMGSASRGNIVHRVIELMGKSGLSVDDLMNGGWKNIANLQQDSEIQANMGNLAMLGLGDDYVQLDNRIESYLSALKDSGLSLTKAAEQVVGMVMHGNMGDIKVAGTFDNIFSYGDELVMGDTKNFMPKGTEAMQLAFGAMAASVNTDLLRSIFTPEQLASINPNMDKVIASVTEQGTRMFQMSDLTENDLYALASYVQNRIETGKSPNLSATNEKSAMGQIAGVRGMGQTDEQRAEYGSFINNEPEIKDKTSAIKSLNAEYQKYLNLLAEEYRLQERLNKVDQSEEDVRKDENQLKLIRARKEAQLQKLELAQANVGDIDSLSEADQDLYERLTTTSNNVYEAKLGTIDYDIAKQVGDSTTKKQQQAIKEYQNALVKSFSYERDIAKTRKEMENLSGQQLKDAQSKLTILQRQYGVYSQIVNGYDRGQKTLNGIALTDEEIASLESFIAEKQSAQDAQLIDINSQYSRQQGLLAQIAGGFKNAFRNITDASLAYTIINQIKQTIREVIDATKQLDAALVDIQIATGNTRNETKNLLKDYSNLADELGRTTQTVATASNDWLRAGYEGKEAAELTKASMMLSTLGMISASDATTYLISTLKGWKIQADEVIDVVDKLTAVDMAAAISAGDLALAMSRANASARLAGKFVPEYMVTYMKY